MTFKGTEFVDGYYGEFPYVPHENVKLYGCVIDQASHKHNCDVVFTESTVGSMSLDVSKESKIPTPISGSSIQLVEVETEIEAQTVDEPAANSGNNDDDDSHPQNDPDCWYGELYVCDDDTGKCDNDRFDCQTDCADGSIVTTGEDCLAMIEMISLIMTVMTYQKIITNRHERDNKY